MFIGRFILLLAAATAPFAAVTAPASDGTEKASAADATTVIGTLGIFGNEFGATFTVDGITRSFTGAGNVIFPGTTATTSTLSFTNDNQLIGVQSFSGTVDATVVTVDLFEGASISWTQDPHVFPPNPIAGNGQWF